LHQSVNLERHNTPFRRASRQVALGESGYALPNAHGFDVMKYVVADG
jgi:hypothetical protein